MKASEDFLLCLKQDLKSVSGRIHASSKFMSGKERLSICNGCGRYNSLLKICKECKCFMPIKVNLAGDNCPIGKW